MNQKHLYKDISENPGVYIMKDVRGAILYIGKAGNLKRRVSSYFLRPNNVRIETMVSHIKSIETKETDSALEALILESALIKKYQPPFNVREKDDTSFLYVVVTHELFPRVLLVRGKDLGIIKGIQFGPYVSSSSIREALRILRKIFQWNMHSAEKIGTYKKPCFEHEIGLCPGTCVGGVDITEYKKTIKKLVLFFEGKKERIISELEREMKMASKQLEFELANKLKKQIFALTHIRDIALISEDNLKIVSPRLTRLGRENSKLNIPATRIEGYDISNISGTSAVGSMVVFVNGAPAKSQYKKFRIKTVEGPNDVQMLREVLTRRFKHIEWLFPDCVLIDGGKPQVNAAIETLRGLKISVPIVGIAKGKKRDKNEFIGTIPKGISEKTLTFVRDEAHRFAIKYHKELRAKKMMESRL
jgi:excinuclease ABC subunit C